MSQSSNNPLANIQRVVDAMDDYNAGNGRITTVIDQLNTLTEHELMVLIMEHPILMCLVENPSEEMQAMLKFTA